MQPERNLRRIAEAVSLLLPAKGGGCRMAGEQVHLRTRRQRNDHIPMACGRERQVLPDLLGPERAGIRVSRVFCPRQIGPAKFAKCAHRPQWKAAEKRHPVLAGKTAKAERITCAHATPSA